MRRRKRFSREETRVASCLSPLGIDHVHNLTLVLYCTTLSSWAWLQHVCMSALYPIYDHHSFLQTPNEVLRYST